MGAFLPARCHSDHGGSFFSKLGASRNLLAVHFNQDA